MEDLQDPTSFFATHKGKSPEDLAFMLTRHFSTLPRIFGSGVDDNPIFLVFVVLRQTGNIKNRVLGEFSKFYVYVMFILA